MLNPGLDRYISHTSISLKQWSIGQSSRVEAKYRIGIPWSENLVLGLLVSQFSIQTQLSKYDIYGVTYNRRNIDS